jgi:hypothetical protein
MEYRDNEFRDLDAAVRRFPAGSRVQIVTGWYKGEQATVESVDEAAFRELGEVVLWLYLGVDAIYLPGSVMQHEVVPV